MTRTRFSACAALLILIGSADARAQAPPQAPQTPPPAPAPDVPAPVSPAGPGRAFAYGVRFGPSFTSLTSVATFDATDVPVASEPTLNFGGFFTFGLRGPLSFQPEVLFAAKGERIRDQDAPPISTVDGLKDAPASRVILLRYLEVPLLIRLAKQTHETTSLYLIAGPAFAFRRNAVIREVADPGKRIDIEDEVQTRNFLYVFGGGLQHKRWMVDMRLTRGVRNVAVNPLPAPVKTNALSVLMGVRL